MHTLTDAHSYSYMQQPLSNFLFPQIYVCNPEAYMYKIRHYSNLRPNTHARRPPKTRQEQDETTRQQALTRNKKKHTNTPGTCVFLSSMSTNSVRCYEIPPAPGKMSHFLFFFLFFYATRGQCVRLQVWLWLRVALLGVSSSPFMLGFFDGQNTDYTGNEIK